MVEIDTLFQTKTAKKENIPFGAAHTYMAEIRDYPSPGRGGNALQIMSLAAYASETNKIVEVWNSANRLLSDFFCLLSSIIFATVTTWRNDFSSLLDWDK